MQSSGDQRLRPRQRLKLHNEFDQVFAARRSRGDEVLVVYVAENELGWSRLGIITSKRVGPAVKRNYARRKIREAFRKLKAELPPGLDIICIAKASAASRATDVGRSLHHLVWRAAGIKVKPEAGSKPRRDSRPGS